MTKLSDTDIDSKLKNLTGWKRTDVGGEPGIKKVYKTGNFLKGLGFITRVAVLAEMAEHHPDIIFTYPRVTMQLTTHDAGGLTKKDFELAKQIDAIKV